MPQKTKAILLMLASAMSFSLMQIAIALTADAIPLFEQLFFRNLIVTFPAYITLRKQGLHCFGQKGNRGLLFARSAFGYLGMITTFSAAGTGNQGDVTTILKMSPVVVMILAFFFLKESISVYQLVGLAVTIVGVCFISNPQFNSDLEPLMVALLACLFSGIAYTMIATLKGKEHPSVIIFFFSLFSTLVTAPLMLSNFVLPTLAEWGLLLLIGLFASLGQMALTYSYTYAKASEVSLYNYSGIVFSMVFGLLFLGQSIKTTSMIGAFLVFLAGAILFFGGKRQATSSNQA